MIETESVDAGLTRLLAYGPEFSGGLSNHGPMALEALESMGSLELAEAFVEHYVQRLEPAEREYQSFGSAADSWRVELTDAAAPSLAKVGGAAGHKLLRLAHGLRSLERSSSEPRRRELTAALDYLAIGRGLPGPQALTGRRPLADVVAGLPRLEPDQRREGLITRNLNAAVALPAFTDAMASIVPAPLDALTDRFDQMALLAGEAMLRNIESGLDAFTMLHGVTVSTMASVVPPYLDETGTRQLEAAIVGFVAAAIIGFDMNRRVEGNEHIVEPVTTEPLAALARSVASSLDDHDIKFADACLMLSHRHPEAEKLLRAMLESRLRTP